MLFIKQKVINAMLNAEVVKHKENACKKRKKRILEYKVKIMLMQLHLTMKARQLLIAETAKASSYGI